jgi:putative SOS response-associated peptidase YedK
MCGRYTLTSPAELQQRFGFVDFHETRPPPAVPRFNVAPSQTVPVVVETPRGRILRPMRWGFRPAWMREAPKRPPPINARAETLLERPMFRGALTRGRCLIPADGFYEWAAVPGARTKRPIYFRLQDGGLFAFAGLYAIRDDGPDAEATCVIITTAANELLAPFHDRMPVILEPEREAEWLDPSQTDPLSALSFLVAYPADQMVAYPVSSLVSAVGNDGPELIVPADHRETHPAD